MSAFQEVGNGAVGANVAQLKTFGGFLKTESAQKIQDLVSKVNGEMGKTAWSGNDAKDFVGDWEKVQTELKKIVEMFEGFGTLAIKQAEQQDQTSQAR